MMSFSSHAQRLAQVVPANQKSFDWFSKQVKRPENHLDSFVRLYFGGEQLSAEDKQWIETLKSEALDDSNLTLERYLKTHTHVFGEKEINSGLEAFYEELRSVNIPELKNKVDRLKNLAKKHPENADIQVLYQRNLNRFVMASFSEPLQDSFKNLNQQKANILEENQGLIKRTLKTIQHRRRLSKLIPREQSELKALGLESFKSELIGLDMAILKSETLPNLLGLTGKLYWQTIKDSLAEQGLPTSGLLYPLSIYNIIFDEGNNLVQKHSVSDLVNKVRETVDQNGQGKGLNLNFSELSTPLYIKTQPGTGQFTNNLDPAKRIFYDLSPKTGEDRRARQTPLDKGHRAIFTVPECGESFLEKCRVFFHELGHAFHTVYSLPEARFSRLYSMNNAVTETHAYLFGNLRRNSHWLMNRVGLSLDEARVEVSQIALENLYDFRRLITTLDFQLSLKDDTPVGNKSKVFKASLRGNTGLIGWANDWNIHLDFWCLNLGYLMAHTLSAQLEQNLKDQFGSPEHDGEDWYENPEAGAYLKTLWAKGVPPVQVFAKELGLDHPLDPKAFIQTMEKILRPKKP